MARSVDSTRHLSIHAVVPRSRSTHPFGVRSQIIGEPSHDPQDAIGQPGGCGAQAGRPEQGHQASHRGDGTGLGDPSRQPHEPAGQHR